MAQPTVVRRLGAHWGLSVAARRQLLGFTQAQLADLCSVTQQTVSQIEAGNRIPRDGLKIVLAAKLGTTPQKLFPWPAMADLTEAVA